MTKSDKKWQNDKMRNDKITKKNDTKWQKMIQNDKKWQKMIKMKKNDKMAKWQKWQIFFKKKLFKKEFHKKIYQKLSKAQ